MMLYLKYLMCQHDVALDSVAVLVLCSNSDTIRYVRRYIKGERSNVPTSS